MEVKKIILECRQEMGGAKRIQPFLNNPKKLDELIALACSQLEYPLPEYSSWLVANIAKQNAGILDKYYNSFVDTILVSKNQTVLRNISNTLNYLPLKEYKEGELLDKLINNIKDDSNKVALFVYSIYILAKFTLKYPEIKSEILSIIENKPSVMKPAMKIGIRNYLKETSKIKA